jgi:hypothetical protein
MACFETGTVVALNDREAITLPDVRGVTLRVTKGTLWLTEERDRNDIVLRPGDNWVVESDGNTVVEAQNDAVFCIVGRPGTPVQPPARARVRTGLLAALAAFFTVPPRHVPYA